jgi:hypothetical protein
MRHAVLGLILAGCAEPPASPPDLAFQVDGRAIHPACVYELHVSLAELQPVATSVDVEGCEASDRYGGGEVRALRGGLEYRDESLFGTGFFAYWPVGRTSDGIHVLHTVENGGGSGAFHRVLFVVLARETFWDEGKVVRRWILRRLGEESLGDRTRDEVSLEGGTVVIRSPDGRRRDISLSGLRSGSSG